MKRKAAKVVESTAKLPLLTGVGFFCRRLPAITRAPNSEPLPAMAGTSGIAILLKNIAEQLQLKDTKIYKAQRYQPSHDDNENPGNF
jgi:hypothetical protein